jgi:hypothetical protein
VRVLAGLPSPLWPGRSPRSAQPAAVPELIPQVTLVQDRKRKKSAPELKQRLKCKAIKCKKTFVTARGCNNHMMKKHLVLVVLDAFTPRNLRLRIEVYYCQHCKSPFLQTQAKQRSMICFFFKLQM